MSLVHRLVGIRNCPRATQRETAAPLPAVPDPPLRRTLCGLDLLGGGIPGDVGGGAALPDGAQQRSLDLAHAPHARGGRSGTLRGGGPVARQPEAPRRTERPPEDDGGRRQGPRRFRSVPGRRLRPSCRCSWCEAARWWTGTRSRSPICRRVDDAGLVEAAMKQFYEMGRMPPPRIESPLDFPERELVAEWLGEKRGGRVEVHVPVKGSRRRMVDLVCRNARLAFDLDFREAGRKAAARGARPPRSPSAPRRAPPHRGVRTSPTWAAPGGGFHGGVRARRTAPFGLPALPDPYRQGKARRLRLHARGRAPPLPAGAHRGTGASGPDPGGRRARPAQLGGRRPPRPRTHPHPPCGPREAGGGDLPARRAGAVAPPRELPGPPASPARPGRSAPLRHHLPPQEPPGRDAPFRARRSNPGSAPGAGRRC